jgi:hypothetical protein
MMLLCTLPVYIVILFINEIITYKKKCIFPMFVYLFLFYENVNENLTRAKFFVIDVIGSMCFMFLFNCDG